MGEAVVKKKARSMQVPSFHRCTATLQRLEIALQKDCPPLQQPSHHNPLQLSLLPLPVVLFALTASQLLPSLIGVPGRYSYTTIAS